MDESGQPQSGTGGATPPAESTGGSPAQPRPRAEPPAHTPPTPAASEPDDRPAQAASGPATPPDRDPAGRPTDPGAGEPTPAAPDPGHRPAQERPGADAPAAPGPDDRPAQERPGADAPAAPDPGHRPAQERPGADAPAAPDPDDRPAQERPGADAPAAPDPGHRPAQKRPGADAPVAPDPDDRPAQERPGESTPAAPRPDRPAAARPGPEDPATEDPARSPYDTHPDRAAATSGTRKGPAKPPPNPRGGILMGRPFGVPVYVAPSWFLVAALITWVFGGQLDRVLPELGAARYLVALFFAVAFYASVLVHELAHVVAALRFKLPVRRIQLQFFGGVSEIEKESETPGREFVLAFVGPLLSLVLSGVFYLAMTAVEPGTVPGVLLAGLMVSNLIVAAFNLLPGLPLDGGRMLRAVVWKLTGKPMSGTIAAAWVGRALAVTVLIGLPLLTQSGALGESAEDVSGMDTVTDALLAAILAAIIWTGAGNSLRMARLREHLPELRARTLTRRAVPVSAATPLSEALRRANESGARALVVVDADGEPRSLVREAAIVGVPEHRRPWVPVSGLAQDLTDGMRVSAELAGEDLLDTLRATPATEYLVVEHNGAIYGVLSAADVERAFVKAMARPA
ncbi:site-2 protease family protein [Streptomyces sp. NPDC049813]|uniref:site-2 protease family protein n=1 Tax=Streptomyces sp. NPDC049813 TaxID=3365597 RepID=UPI00379C2951